MGRHLPGNVDSSRKKSEESEDVSSQPEVSSQNTAVSPSARSLLTALWVACSSWPRRGRMMKIGIEAGAVSGMKLDGLEFSL